jgi:hypothetical protein
MMLTTLHQAWSTVKTDVCAIVSSLWKFYIRVQVPHVASNCLGEKHNQKHRNQLEMD